MKILDIHIEPQPNGVTCGPTCLHAIYHYLGNTLTLNEVIQQVSYLENGGTLAVLLGCHALTLGYQVTLHSLNMYILDPTWIALDKQALLHKLNEQITRSKNPKIITTTKAYCQFLELGGTICFSEITEAQLARYIDNNIPLLSGVNSTYLYTSMRDYTGAQDQVVYDEFLGEPTGHFVVLRGCDTENHKLFIADPYAPQSLSTTHYYDVSFAHWLHAHLLGISTYDTELLAIENSVSGKATS